MTIAVIGEIMVDRYVYGVCERISPEAPVPIVKHLRTEDRPGGAANVYHNIKSLMDEVVLSVECEHPPVKMRVFAQDHYMSRIDFNDGGNNWLIRDNYRDADIIVVSDYNKGLFKHLDYIKHHNSHAKYIVDPKKSLEHYSGAWCLKPNKVEFENHAGKWTTLEQLKEKMECTISELLLEHLIVTLGSDGVAYMSRTGKFVKFPAQVVEVNDPTGCGDTFISTLAVILHHGGDMIEAIKMANKAASVAVSHLGTYIIKPSDLGL